MIHDPDEYAAHFDQDEWSIEVKHVEDWDFDEWLRHQMKELGFQPPEQPRIVRRGNKVFVLTDSPQTEIGKYEIIALMGELCQALDGGVVRELLIPKPIKE